MKKWIVAVFLAVCVFMSACSQANQEKISELKITKLRCEYLKNPLGIDAVKPRLSWILESSDRGQKQTAYRIIVSSSEENLEKDIGDLWYSGKVESDRTNQIVYDGKELHSRKKCCWKVFVWDNNRIKRNGKAHGYLWKWLPSFSSRRSWHPVRLRPGSGKHSLSASL